MNLLLHSYSSSIVEKHKLVGWSSLITKMLFLGMFSFFSTTYVGAETGIINYDICDDVTDAGTISGDETGCNDPVFDPSIIISTSPATGGSNALQYLWTSTTDDPNGISSIWNIIPGSSGESFDPGPITETTYYRRCAQRVGCTIWIQESNIVVKTVQCMAPCDLEIRNITGVNPMCTPGNTGIIALSIKGGTAPITYLWSNGDTTEDITNLDAGTYCVTVTDANGCTVTDCATIVAPDPINPTVQITQTTCGDLNGAIDLSVSGGTAPYIYAWNNGATTQDLSNLAAGTYCVIITDSKGCDLNACYVVNPSNNNTVTINPNPSTICPGESITLTASGTSTNSYVWSTSAGTLSSNTGSTVSYTIDISGSYTITVQATDANGCIANTSTIVTVSNPVFVSGTPNSATCGANNGSITTSTSGGVAPYTYAWDNGATTADLNNLAAGTYCLTVTDTNGCTDTDCYNVGEIGAMPVSITPSQTNICLGESVSFTANGNGITTYLWSATAGNLSSTTGQNTSYTANTTGTFTVTVQSTDSNGCMAMASATVTVNPMPNISGTPSPATCNENNGSITVSVSNGTTPNTYLWNNGATTATISNLAADQYCVTVTNASGCIDTDCFTIEVIPTNPVSVTPTQSTVCPGELVTFTANGDAATTYFWSATAGNLSSTSGQSVTYSANISGTNTITVQATDANGCISTSNATVIVANPIIVSGIPSPATCGVANGSISTTVTGGTLPYTYIWNNGATTPNLTDLVGGQFCVTVTDTNGCSNSACFIVEEIGATPVSISGPSALCPGESITLTASGDGTSTYFWSATAGILSSSTGQSVDYTMSMPGTYIITVQATDVNGCMATDNVTVTVNSAPEITGTTSPATCGLANGSVDLVVASGTMPYTYAWNTGATTVSINNLAAGQYCVTATDANGCTNSACFDVQEIIPVQVSISGPNSLCPGETITFTASGIITGTYLWSANAGTLGSTTGQSVSFSADIPGIYTVGVQATDANGCTSQANTTVKVHLTPTISGAVTAATCGGDNGSIITDISSGLPPFTYLWSTAATTANLDNLAPGQYCVTATDANGCNGSACFDVQEIIPVPVTISAPNAFCQGEIMTLTASGDNSTYIWASNAGTLSSTTGQSISFSADIPGSFTIVVQATDINGCISTANAIITVNQNPTINGAISPATCAASNGSITTNISTGLAPFTYIWSNAETTADLNNLVAGQYCVTVTDANGCTSDACFTVEGSQNIVINLTTTPIRCDLDGSVTANVTNGLSPFVYNWNTGATTASINAPTAGDYCVTVTDANGCIQTECTTLLAPIMPNVIGTAQDPTCDLANGSITASADVPVTYSWSTGATTATIQNLAAGTYTVTVTAVSNGCQDIASFTLISTVTLSVALDPTNPACVGMDNGAVGTMVDYTGSGTLSYTWNTGATTSEIDNLPAGQYCVTVTSTDGCENMACTTLTAPDAINANAFLASAGCMAANGNIKLAVTGGTAPYTFKWSNGEITQDIEDLVAGTYCVTICDFAGCINTSCFVVDGGVNFNTSVNKTDVVCNGGNDGSAIVATDGGTTPFTYTWSNGATTAAISNLVAGNYCVTVTDVFGCSSVSCTDILEPSLVDINATATNTTCNNDNGTATVTSTSTNATIAWSNGATTGTITNLVPGTYSVTITNTAGCTATTSVTVNPSIDITVDVTPSNTTVCLGEAIMLTSMSNQNTGVTYTYTTTGGNLSNTNTNTTTFTTMTPGTYIISIDVVNTVGCTDTDQATIVVLDANDSACTPPVGTVNIGDFVFIDANNNGIQDSEDSALVGIDVKLMTAGPDGIFYTADDVTIETVTTNTSGLYLFTDVAPDDYVIMFCLTLPGIDYTIQNAGGNDELDSDANPANGKTDPFTVVAGQDDDLSFDAGFIIIPTGGCDNLTDGGEICCDQIICGAGGPVDPITNVISPSGGSGAIEYIWMSSTVGGVFSTNTFSEIPGANGPTYDPGIVTQTIFLARCSRRAGCDNYKESNIIKLQVNPSPATTINSLPAFICVGETDNFNALDAGIGATYSWDLGEGANPATATGQNIVGASWSTPGAKIITLTTTNATCSVTLTRMVQVGSCLTQEETNRFISLEAIHTPETTEVNLNWQTRNDINDYVFLVEHSADGENYDVIHTMDGVDAYESKNYGHLDLDARPGRNFYRIQHINNNGRTDKSEIAMVVIEDINTLDKFIVFPNPTQDYVIFESLKLTEEEGRIMISDMSGKILKEIVIPANTTRQRVDISNYPAGNYIFSIRYHDVRSIPRMINKMDK